MSKKPQRMPSLISVEQPWLAFQIDVSAVTDKPFQDVEAGAWYAPYITAIKNRGIVTGYYGGTTYEPDSNTTRAEALKIILTTAGIKIVGGSTAQFTDIPQDAWYLSYVASAVQNGIVDGYSDGTFHPDNPITRAEISKMIVNTMATKAAEKVSAAK